VVRVGLYSVDLAGDWAVGVSVVSVDAVLGWGEWGRWGADGGDADWKLDALGLQIAK
jgi:hypothetical protein